jgi:hypothetical protein
MVIWIGSERIFTWMVIVIMVIDWLLSSWNDYDRIFGMVTLWLCQNSYW